MTDLTWLVITLQWLVVGAIWGIPTFWGLSVLYRGLWGGRDANTRQRPGCSAGMRQVEGRTCPGCKRTPKRESKLHPRKGVIWRAIVVGAGSIAFGTFVAVAVFTQLDWSDVEYGRWAQIGSALVTAGVITSAVLAIVLFARGMVGDPARGRPRCPKCWYSMAGATGLECPECGKRAATPQRLFRRRRLKRFLFFSGLMIGLILGPLAAQKIVRDGAVSLVPTRVLLWGIDWMPSRWVGSRWDREDTLMERVRGGRLTESQIHFVLGWTIRGMASAATDAEARRYCELFSSVLLSTARGQKFETVDLTARLDEDHLSGLATVLESGHPLAQDCVGLTALRFAIGMETAFDGGLEAMARHGNHWVRGAALGASLLSQSRDQSIELLQGLIEPEVPEVLQIESMRVYLRRSRTDPLVAASVQGVFDSLSLSARTSLLRVTGSDGLDMERTAREAVTQGSVADARSGAIYLLHNGGLAKELRTSVVATLGGHPDGLDVAFWALDSDDPATAVVLMHAWLTIAEQPKERRQLAHLMHILTIAALRELVNHPDPDVSEAAKALLTRVEQQPASDQGVPDGG